MVVGGGFSGKGRNENRLKYGPVTHPVPTTRSTDPNRVRYTCRRHSSADESRSAGRCPNENRKPSDGVTAPGTLKHYGRRMKLNCRHGYNILIFPDGTVCTSDDDTDGHCVMEFTSMSPGHVRIKGVRANAFLAMDKNGRLYAEVHAENDVVPLASPILTVCALYVFSPTPPTARRFSSNSRTARTARTYR